MDTFRNPLTKEDGSDPFMTYDPVTGYYYSMNTRHSEIRIYRSRHAASIRSDNDSRVVYMPEFENRTYCAFWAPEMHKAPNGKWYIYTSSIYREEDYKNGHGQKRLFILESETEDPFDGFHFKSRPDDAMYAIDPTVYTTKEGKQYICYSYCSDAQYLEIRELIDPYTFGEKRAIISAPIYDWEKLPPQGTWRINEGAFFVENEEKLFIVYSYNGCFCDDYGLAVLEYTGGDLCDASSWKKYDHPLFTKGNGVFGPGHASFFRSPDGKELWVCYHCLATSDEKETQRTRYMNIQKMHFDLSGRLKEDVAVGWNVDLCPPSGECEEIR